VIEGERRKPCHIFRFQSIAFHSKLHGVTYQNRIPLVHYWGGGEVASEN
jgi:hypothetical protein